MKEAVISINSIQGCEEESENNIEFTTDGLYSYENGIPCMRYYETDVTGMPGTRTTLSVEDDRVIVDREGSITSRMVFEKGKKSSFLYNTPYGNATMGMDTRSIRHSFDENGGSMEIVYVVDMEHTVVTRNKFRIKVTELR